MAFGYDTSHKVPIRKGESRVTPEIPERAFEETIECTLLRLGPDACPDDAMSV